MEILPALIHWYAQDQMFHHNEMQCSKKLFWETAFWPHLHSQQSYSAILFCATGNNSWFTAFTWTADNICLYVEALGHTVGFTQNWLSGQRIFSSCWCDFCNCCKLSRACCVPFAIVLFALIISGDIGKLSRCLFWCVCVQKGTALEFYQLAVWFVFGMTRKITCVRWIHCALLVTKALHSHSWSVDMRRRLKSPS